MSAAAAVVISSGSKWREKQHSYSPKSRAVVKRWSKVGEKMRGVEESGI